MDNTHDFLPVECDDGSTTDDVQDNAQNEFSFIDAFGDLDGLQLQELNMDELLPPGQHTFTMHGVPFAPLQGVQVVTGQSGSGKTMLMCILMGTTLRGEYAGLKYTGQPPRILYVDTEMEGFNTQAVAQRVCDIAGRKYGAQPDFHVLVLRDVVDLNDRWRQVAKAIKTYEPTAIFLDGMLDLVMDFNSASETQYIIRGCMELATRLNACMWCLAHQNPGREEKIAGHLGSFLDRKATDILLVQREKRDNGQYIFNVTHKKTRGAPIDDFSFHMDVRDDGLAIPRIYTPEENPNVKPNVPQDMNEFARQILPADGREVPTDVIRHTIRTIYGISKAEAERHLKDAIAFGAIKTRMTKEGRMHSLPDTSEGLFKSENGNDGAPF